jgi:hypothetical protein
MYPVRGRESWYLSERRHRNCTRQDQQEIRAAETLHELRNKWFQYFVRDRYVRRKVTNDVML